MNEKKFTTVSTYKFSGGDSVSHDVPVISSIMSGDTAKMPVEDILRGSKIFPVKYGNDMSILTSSSHSNSGFNTHDSVVSFLDSQEPLGNSPSMLSEPIASTSYIPNPAMNTLPINNPNVKSQKPGFNFDAYGNKYADYTAVPPPTQLRKTAFSTEAEIQAGEDSIVTYDRSSNAAGKISSVAKSNTAGESLMGAGGDTGLAMAMGVKSYFANKSYVASDTGTTGGKIAAENDQRLGENISTGIIGGASAGAAIGSFGGPIGSAVGGFIGAGLGGLVGGLTTHTRTLSSVSGANIDPNNSIY